MRKSSILRAALAVFLLLPAMIGIPGRAAEAGETSLSLWGDAGDWVVGPQQLYFPAENNTFTVIKNQDNGVTVLFNTPGYSHWWNLFFAAPYDQLLTPGSYPGAITYPTQVIQPGFSLGGDGRGCQTTGATFQIKQILYGVSDSIDAFWATFEQHCEGVGPAAYGEIRFNADLNADSVVLAAPLAVSVARNETLTLDVSAASGKGLPITLTATGLPVGAFYTDNGDNTGTFVWTPSFDQMGQYTVTFRGENGVGLIDTAITVITVTDATSLALIGQPGDYIVGDQQFFITQTDGVFNTQKNFDNGVSISVDLSETWWDLDFSAAYAQPLTVGLYNGAMRFAYRSPSAPGLELSGDGRGCNKLTGSFEVKQIVYGTGNAIDKFWATFEQHCEAAVAAAYGEILFHSDAVMLKVAKAGNGHGTVISDGAGINCGTICTRGTMLGSVIDLAAVPASDSVFTGWTGPADCSEQLLTMDKDKLCTAVFTLKTYTIQIMKVNGGSSTVMSNPAGISCGTVCSANLSGSVILSATPAADSVFTGWSGGGCSGTGPCVVTVDRDIAVTATFEPAGTLTIELMGEGTGRITGTGGIDCTKTCTKTLTIGTAVTLQAAPSPGFILTAWQADACSGTLLTCTFTFTGSTFVTAYFNKPFVVAVTKTGNGSGTVRTNPVAIDCGETCSMRVDGTSPVVLVATPSQDSVFTGWGGDGCSGTGDCVLNNVSAHFRITANFELKPFSLSVSKSGTGTGTVTSSPAAIDCGSDCSEVAVSGSSFTLTATPSPDSVFTGWSGACSGTGSCGVTLNSDKTVTANFALKTFSVTVSKSGNGVGSVDDAQGVAYCGTNCSGALKTFSYGTVLILNAAPSAGSIFAGWSGACTGTGACTVTISSNTSITATFPLIPNYTLTVGRNGSGTGTVSSAPAGINCGIDCSETAVAGSSFTLTASPSADSVFTGWTGGGCAGTGSCGVTLNSSTNVAANFALKTYNLNVSKLGAGTGSITSAPSGINCGSSCALALNSGSSLTLSATPSANSVFLGWSGACGGTGACALTMISDTAVSASFALKTFTLNAAIDGSGSGSISSSPLGISCGSDCAEVFSIGTSVNLTATASPDSVFIGWGGACGGAGACSVTMNSDKSVTANFSKRLVLTSPNGGQVWRKGTNQTIAWTSTGMNSKAKVKVDYSADGGTTWTNIISTGANDGAQKWKVNKPATNQGRVRVCTATAPVICDTSNANFTIQ